MSKFSFVKKSIVFTMMIFSMSFFGQGIVGQWLGVLEIQNVSRRIVYNIIED